MIYLRRVPFFCPHEATLSIVLILVYTMVRIVVSVRVPSYARDNEERASRKCVSVFYNRAKKFAAGTIPLRNTISYVLRSIVETRQAPVPVATIHQRSRQRRDLAQRCLGDEKLPNEATATYIRTAPLPR